MLLQPTLDKLNGMRLLGMAEALRRFADTTPLPDVAPQDLVAMLADAEWLWRENNKLKSRLRKATLRMNGAIEDIDYAHSRGLQKPLIRELSSSRWVQEKRNIILTGPTGIGKSYIACALGQKACRDGFVVMYRRVTRLFDELALARADGTLPVVMRRLAKANVLILDDFGPQPLSASERRDLLDVIEDRYDVSSTVLTSQLLPKLWHGVIADATMADSVCDRLVHNAHRIELEGESVRKAQARRRASKADLTNAAQVDK